MLQESSHSGKALKNGLVKHNILTFCHWCADWNLSFLNIENNKLSQFLPIGFSGKRETT